MGQINVVVGGHSYPLACRDGEEARLTSLAGHLNRKAEELSTALGRMSEPRLLLMAGILVADELFELRESLRVNGGARAPDEEELTRLFNHLAARVEAMAEALEHGPDKA